MLGQLSLVVRELHYHSLSAKVYLGCKGYHGSRECTLKIIENPPLCRAKEKDQIFQLLLFPLVFFSGYHASDVMISASGYYKAVIFSYTLSTTALGLFLSWDKWCQWSRSLVNTARKCLTSQNLLSNPKNIRSMRNLDSVQCHRDAVLNIKSIRKTAKQKPAAPRDKDVRPRSTHEYGKPNELVNKPVNMAVDMRDDLALSSPLPPLQGITLSISPRMDGEPPTSKFSVPKTRWLGWRVSEIVYEYLKPFAASIFKRPSLRMSQLCRFARPKVEPGDRRVEWICVGHPHTFLHHKGLY